MASSGEQNITTNWTLAAHPQIIYLYPSMMFSLSVGNYMTLQCLTAGRINWDDGVVDGRTEWWMGGWRNRHWAPYLYVYNTYQHIMMCAVGMMINLSLTLSSLTCLLPSPYPCLVPFLCPSLGHGPSDGSCPVPCCGCGSVCGCGSFDGYGYRFHCETSCGEIET